MMCLEQTENCFRLNPRVAANNNAKNFDSQLYRVVCIHILGELDNFYATLLIMITNAMCQI